MATENDEKYLVCSATKGHGKRKKKKKKHSKDSKRSTGDLPQEIIDLIHEVGSYDAELVMEKPLSKLDTTSLTMRFKAAAKRKFLTDVEGDIIPVLFIEPSLDVRDMSLAGQSIFIAGGHHILLDDWDIVKKKKGLQTSDLVQIWAIKIIEGDDIDEPKLGFALVKVDKDQQHP